MGKYFVLMTIAFLALTVLFFSVVLSGCSSDDAEDDPMVEEVLTPEPEPPDWVDGVLSIQVGRFWTGRDLYFAVKEAEVRMPHRFDMLLAEMSAPDFSHVQPPANHRCRRVYSPGGWTDSTCFVWRYLGTVSGIRASSSNL